MVTEFLVSVSWALFLTIHILLVHSSISTFSFTFSICWPVHLLVFFCRFTKYINPICSTSPHCTFYVCLLLLVCMVVYPSIICMLSKSQALAACSFMSMNMHYINHAFIMFIYVHSNLVQICLTPKRQIWREDDFADKKLTSQLLESLKATEVNKENKELFATILEKVRLYIYVSLTYLHLCLYLSRYISHFRWTSSSIQKWPLRIRYS